MRTIIWPHLIWNILQFNVDANSLLKNHSYLSFCWTTHYDCFILIIRVYELMHDILWIMAVNGTTDIYISDS